MKSPSSTLLIALSALILLFAVNAAGQAIQYERPVQAAPQEEGIGGSYKTPAVQKPQPRAYWLEVLDVVLLAIAMGISVWVVLSRRSRKWVLVLTVACLGYFGFYREGCICPIGSIQNVSVALTDPSYAIPIVVTAVFFLPLLVALFFGRAFCGGVCPLGALQELVVLKPLQVPRRLDRALGLLRYAYLGGAVWLALQPFPVHDFIICRFDPFVGFFRMAGFAHMFYIGAAFLVLGIFVGRPYCRFLCPYGVLLEWVTRFAGRGVSITPDKELDCGLCQESCPYGAIEKMRVVQPKCFYCARCFESCPREGQLAKKQ